jgi:hypothetical protein
MFGIPTTALLLRKRHASMTARCPMVFLLMILCWLAAKQLISGKLLVLVLGLCPIHRLSLLLVLGGWTFGMLTMTLIGRMANASTKPLFPMAVRLTTPNLLVAKEPTMARHLEHA